MGAYMYPIIINREKKTIRYERKVSVYGLLTVKNIIENVKDNETFDVFFNDGGLQAGQYVLNICGKRLETDEEQQKRIEREEKYMENYTKFHANKQ